MKVSVILLKFFPLCKKGEYSRMFFALYFDIDLTVLLSIQLGHKSFCVA